MKKATKATLVVGLVVVVACYGYAVANELVKDLAR
jgi:hypothetical protein